MMRQKTTITLHKLYSSERVKELLNLSPQTNFSKRDYPELRFERFGGESGYSGDSIVDRLMSGRSKFSKISSIWWDSEKSRERASIIHVY